MAVKKKTTTPRPAGQINYSTIIPKSQGTYTNAVGSSWNNDIQNKINDLQSKGKTVYVGYDDNGQLHYSTKGMDRVKGIIDNYNTGVKGVYDYKGYEYAPDKDSVKHGADLDDIYQNYAQMLQANVGSQAPMEEAKKAAADNINAYYDNTARDYYKLYKSQEARLPEQLSKAGIDGGMTETARLGLLNNYGTNVANSEMGRARTLGQNEADYQTKIAERSEDVADRLANAYLAMAKEQLNMDRADEERQQYIKAQTALQNRNAKVSQRINEQIAKGKQIWTWQDATGLHWTTNPTTAAQIKASAPVSGVKNFSKIKGEVSKVGGGGGGGGSSKGRKYTSGGGGGSTPTVDVNNAFGTTPSTGKTFGGGAGSFTSGTDPKSVYNQAKFGIVNAELDNAYRGTDFADLIGNQQLIKTVERVENSGLSDKEKVNLYKSFGLDAFASGSGKTTSTPKKKTTMTTAKKTTTTKTTTTKKGGKNRG